MASLSFHGSDRLPEQTSVRPRGSWSDSAEVPSAKCGDRDTVPTSLTQSVDVGSSNPKIRRPSAVCLDGAAALVLAAELPEAEPLDAESLLLHPMNARSRVATQGHHALVWNMLSPAKRAATPSAETFRNQAG